MRRKLLYFDLDVWNYMFCGFAKSPRPVQPGNFLAETEVLFDILYKPI